MGILADEAIETGIEEAVKEAITFNGIDISDSNCTFIPTE